MTPFFTMEYFTHRPFFFTLVFDTDKDYSKAKNKMAACLIHCQFEKLLILVLRQKLKQYETKQDANLIVNRWTRNVCTRCKYLVFDNNLGKS